MPLVASGVGVELAAAGAQPELRGRPLVAGDRQPAAVARQAGVDPPQVHRAQVGAAEAGLLDEPLVAHPRRVDVGGEEHLEQRVGALVGAVGDHRLVAAHLGGGVRELDDVDPLAAVGDRGRPAPRAADDAAGEPAELDVGREAAGRAEHPGAHGLAVHAEVDRVDGDLPAAGIERGAWGELPDGLRRCALELRVLGLEGAGVGVGPAQPDVEGDRVVEQGVVRQDPVLLEHADPVLALQVRELTVGELARDPGRPDRPPVVVGRGRGVRLPFELGQHLLDRGAAVAQGLDHRLPAPARGMHVRGEAARARTMAGQHPVSKGLQGVLAHAVQGRREPCQVAARVGLGELDEVAEEGARLGRADRAARLAGVPAPAVAGHDVDEVRGVLAAQDLLGLEVGRRRADLAVDDRQRLAELGQVIPAPGDIGEGQCVAGQPPGASDPLEVGRDRGRQRRQEHRRKLADVDAELQGRGRDEHVGCLRIIACPLEAVLVGEPGLVVEQARVLAGDDAPHVG